MFTGMVSFVFGCDVCDGEYKWNVSRNKGIMFRDLKIESNLICPGFTSVFLSTQALFFHFDDVTISQF